MSRLQRWGIAFGLTILAIAICYVAIDRPFVLFVHERLAQFKPFFVFLTRVPEAFSVAATLIVVGLGVRSLTGRPLSRPCAVALVWSLSFLVTTVIDRQLKFAFGRTWPETWVNNNPSFIQDGAYGFNPFHGGMGFAAFPSGHMAAICVAASVLWVSYPRLQGVYALLVAIVTIGLIGANFHFLSDIIAGGYLGVSIGCLAVALWDAGGYVRLRAEKVRPPRTIRKRA